MFTEKQFNILAEVKASSSPCISIYVPTYRAGNNQEDQLRFKNALSEAAKQLTAGFGSVGAKMDKQQAQQYISKGYELLDDDDFWMHLSDGLAVFIGADHFSHVVANVDFTPSVYVADHYYLRHLLPLLSKDNRFFVLALSQNEVRFFEGRENSITPVVIEDLLPNGVDEMVGVEDETKNVQAHSGGNTAIYHGQGSGKDQKNELLKKYFRQVDSGLMEMLHDENAPLIIYSVDYQIPLYKEISKYGNFAATHVTGNPENDDPVLIHEKTWAVIKDYFAKEKSEKTKHFNDYMRQEKGSISITHILPAAMHGKVDSLFVDKVKDFSWGVYDEKKNAVTIHPSRQNDSICLLNRAAVATFENGGTVYNIPRMEFPNIFAELNAIYRY